MILNKALLLKCLGGVAACTGVAVVSVLGSQMDRGDTTNSSFPANNLQTESIVKKAGLSCDDENSTTGSNCTKKDGHGNISVKQDSNTITLSSIPSDSGQGKIKLYKDSGTDGTTYNGGFKLVIEEGDIVGTTNSNKLEQFETYEIKEESGNYILFRKTKASKGIKTALGLPDGCTLPEESSTSGATCTISTSNIGTVKFDGVSDGQTVTSSGDITLTVTKLSTSDSDFPFDYKFELKATSSNSTTTLSLGNNNTITLKNTEATEFKIKKTTGNSLTLEEAWSLTRLLEKVGLSGCTTAVNGTECSISSLKVKQESGEENKTKQSDSSGKIKVYSDTTYNKGFKFVIEEGDISLTGGSGTVNKLEQFETYEIKKDETDNKWYLTRKSKAEEGIKKALGLDGIDNCNFPTDANNPSSSCDLDADKLKKIKFDGKPENQDTTITDSGTTKLTITKVSDDSKSDFPLGYKFAFESTQDITIPQSSGNISIKKKTNTEFKIKVTQSSGSTPVKLSLEKAWTAKSLGEKVGLSCPEPTDNGEKKCDFTEGSINVNNGSDNSKITNGKFKNSSEATGKKMTYEEDQADYNQGIRFYLDESNDIALTNDANGSGSTEDKKINKKNGDNGGSEVYYEIKEDTGDKKWYLTKHTPASK